MENNKYDGPEKEEDFVELLPIQEWFLQKEINRNHFNHSFLIRVDETIDKERLETALTKLNIRHDMLRARYGDGKQTCRKNSNIAGIREWSIKGKTVEDLHRELTNWQNRFDIEKGYLWQSGIIRGYDDGSERIYLAVHHLVYDAASWSIVCEDLKNLYENKEPGGKTSSYREWVEAVKEYGRNATPEEKRYWEEFRGAADEHQREWSRLAEDDDRDLRFARVEFTEEVTGKLLQAARKFNNCTIHDLLLGGLSHALDDVSGNKKNWITMEMPGREQIDSRIDLSRTVGWFTSMYPFCLAAENNIKETIIANRKRIEKIPHHGLGYGAIHGYGMLPKVLFNYLGTIRGTTEKDWPICLGEERGEGMDPDNRYGNILDMNGLCLEGKIRFAIESFLKEENHELLCASFKKYVETIALL